MSRPIEYRAWDVHNDEMRTVVEIHFNDDGLPGVTFEDGTGLDYCNTIVQYTGLKDMNGARIFEEDFIKSISHGFTGRVVFRSGCFWIQEYYEDKPVDVNAQWSINIPCEIIGNKYEGIKKEALIK